MDNFEVYLVSNGSMQLYPNNTLASFTNHLSEPLQLDGNWRVSLSSISIPTAVKNISNGDFIGFNGVSGEEWRISGDEDGLATVMELYSIKTGIYPSVNDLLLALEKSSGVKIMDEATIDPIDGKLLIMFKSLEGFTFPNNEIPNILGIVAKTDYINSGYTGMHIGFKNQRNFENSETPKKFAVFGDYPVNITHGQNLVFVYLNIIEYQHVADTKAPLLRLFSRNVKLKNGTIQSNETQTSVSFKDLEYKKLLSNNIQSIKVEIRTESGELVPFLDTGRTTVTLKFQRAS